MLGGCDPASSVGRPQLGCFPRPLCPHPAAVLPGARPAGALPPQHKYTRNQCTFLPKVCKKACVCFPDKLMEALSTTSSSSYCCYNSTVSCCWWWMVSVGLPVTHCRILSRNRHAIILRFSRSRYRHSPTASRHNGSIDVVPSL